MKDSDPTIPSVQIRPSAHLQATTGSLPGAVAGQWQSWREIDPFRYYLVTDVADTVL
jgi:hypothetical protein